MKKSIITFISIFILSSVYSQSGVMGRKLQATYEADFTFLSWADNYKLNGKYGFAPFHNFGLEYFVANRISLISNYKISRFNTMQRLSIENPINYDYEIQYIFVKQKLDSYMFGFRHYLKGKAPFGAYWDFSIVFNKINFDISEIKSFKDSNTNLIINRYDSYLSLSQNPNYGYGLRTGGGAQYIIYDRISLRVGFNIGLSLITTMTSDRIQSDLKTNQALSQMYNLYCGVGYIIL